MAVLASNQAARRVTPVGVETRPPSSRGQLDDVVARLQEGARRFTKLSLDARVALARSMQQGYVKVADSSVRAACLAKGIAPGSPAAGEEWVAPSFVVRHLRLVQESLRSLQRTGTTPIGPVSHTIDGQLAVEVFPANRIDGVLFNGVRVDVQLRPGITQDGMQATRARFYRNPDHDGRVVVVLSAGNINAIASMDVITKMFNEGKVCVLKMNPVNAYLGPFLEQAFAEAIAPGFLAVVYGGANEGEYLAHHAGIDEIHLTGSDKTFDLLVWGPPGADRELRKRQGNPLLRKPITAELGNVTPVLLVPGPYTDKELAYQAEDVASGLTFNASFNCNAPKVLVTPRGWPQREQFLTMLEAVLSRVATRAAYYPGAAERWRLFSAGRDDLRTIGGETEARLPWTLAPGLDPANSGERAFTTESFCPILFETQVGSADPIEFLTAAVDFANQRLWGTLTAQMIIHPRTHRDHILAPAVERAITNLHYGVVCVNAWSGFVFTFGTPPWGAYPGSTLGDIQSGQGTVHNTVMLEGIEKAVLRHPLTMKPKPVTFPTHRTANLLMRKLARLEERASWARVPGVVATALRG